MRYLFLAAAVISTSVSFQSCRKQEPVMTNLSQDYNVIFYPDEGKTSAFARFLLYPEGGKYVSFSDRTQVTANGVTDNRNVAYPDNRYFIWSFSGTRDVTFGFRKPDSTIYNTVARSEMGTLSIIADSVYSLHDTISIDWVGDTILPHEYIEANLLSSLLPDGSRRGVIGYIDGHKIVFDLSRASTFLPGIYEISVEKSKTIDGQNRDGYAPVHINCMLHVRKFVRLM